ncbi:hypothetical protein M5K25_001038 [Dendrobium thyrsiflorum]|uniref:R13L1/DRL21-like LRR repeat region domain-containing protein n=1 Tax=Dendrobium thyrsiflorum TaxID=117978 RepID=A0ABD0WF99_DENTH
MADIIAMFSRWAKSGHVALRSIFCYGRRIINDFRLLDSIRLRVLHIEIDQFDSNLSKFLGSIASMKHLRYLYFHAYKWHPRSDKVDLSSLFNSLHSIFNVQVLDFFGCHFPIMLPASIKNLINLRHLILPRGSIMPCGISKLTCLQTLKVVVVKDGNHEGGGLGEIEDLASLTGSCCICGIDYANNVEDFKKANINGKKHIRRLFIDWHHMLIYPIILSFDIYIYFKAKDRVKNQSFELEEAKLEALRPHNNLKELKIHNYPGILFPSWLGDPSYSKLQDITLKGCNKWDGSGGVLDRDLPCLQNCRKLTSIPGLQNLPSLEELKLKHCWELELTLEEKLSTMPNVLEIVDCPQLKKWCQRYGYKYDSSMLNQSSNSLLFFCLSFLVLAR